MTIKMYELKALLKEKAREIKTLRQEIKDGQRKGKYMGDHQWKLIALKANYRHHHIAYSEMRGKTIEQIERNSKTAPDRAWIDRIKETYHEDVRACA